MEKRTIAIWWIAGLAAMIPGALLIIASALALAAHLEPIMPGTFNNWMPDGYARALVTLIVIGGIFAGAGIGSQLGAWMAAVSNARQLADKRWGNALLWIGIAGLLTAPLFGLGALISGSLMIAYLVGGPDGMTSQPSTTLEKRTIKKWSDSAVIAMVTGTFFALLVSHATNPGGLLHGRLWLSFALLSLGFMILGTGVTAMTVAWWSAVFNTHRLADKTWFNLLLGSGIVGAITSPLFGIGTLIGLGVMIAYLRTGPDGTTMPTVFTSAS